MAVQERPMDGVKDDLIQLGNLTALIASASSRAANLQAGAKVLRAQADAEDAKSDTEVLKQNVLIGQVNAIREKLGIPLNVAGYKTDFTKGVYTWEEPDNDTKHLAPAAGE